MALSAVPSSLMRVVWLLPVLASSALLTMADVGYASSDPEADQRQVPIPHWDEAPSSLADYQQHGGRTVVDPWVYTERLGLYKILLRATSGDPTLGKANNTANILWGLPLQHGWQFSSGRLLDFPNGTRCSSATSTVRMPDSWNCISPFSWWASMNYFLSVLPFLGAVKAGVFSQWPYEIEFASSSHRPQDYCTNLANCTTRFPTVVRDWADFFRALKYRQESPDPYHITAIQGSGSNLPPAPPSTFSPREQEIITKLWVAHTNSLETAQPLFNVSLLPLMSKPEQIFGLSWAHLIGYIAAVDFVTDLNTTFLFQQLYLPRRVLQPEDRPPKIPDFPRDVNLALYILETALQIDQTTGDALKHAWQALMCSLESQARGRSLISNLLSPLEAMRNLVILLWLYLTVCLWHA